VTKKTILAGGAGLAALVAAAPATAQYYPYAYGSPYGASPYAYNATAMASQRCAAAVQSRLSRRVGVAGILGAVLGAPATTGRVLSVTQVVPRSSTVRVRGIASSGRMAYSPYGVGMYGSLGAAYAPDLSFKCDVDYRGYIRDIDIMRR
jgi:hypothetical protein